jgi:hypothetical protein
MRQLLVLTLLFAAACNPTRRIDMKNHSGDDASITWTMKDGDSLYRSYFFISNSTELKFDLKPNSPYNEVRMSFGMGAWKKDTLKIITKPLQSLQIKSNSGTIQLDSQEEIYTFLWNRRKGITKRKIEILIGR